VEKGGRRNPRGLFQKVPGKNSPWWIRYAKAQGRFRREKAGTKSGAIHLYRKRKYEALEGKKLPEKLCRATVSFAEIAKDALTYSKANKLSYRTDTIRMETLLSWLREYPAQSITPHAIECASPGRIAELASNTGNRLSEQYRLRWEDVSFTRRTLTIPRSKNGATRHVPLNRAALGALESKAERTTGSEFVCGGTTEPRRWFEPVVKASGLKNFTWHCLRHTFASRLVMAEVGIRTVQKLLGHKTISMTVRYSHLAPKHALAAVERLDATTGEPIDTTTDTGAIPPAAQEVQILQQVTQ
jgi:integrase